MKTVSGADAPWLSKQLDDDSAGRSAAAPDMLRSLSLWKAAYAKDRPPMNDRNGEIGAHAEPMEDNSAAISPNPLSSQLAAPWIAEMQSMQTATPHMLPSGLDSMGLPDLLRELCSNLYVAQSAGPASANRLMLEIGAIAPGAMVELVRNGASLHVRLHAADRKTLELLQRTRGKLMEALMESTHLDVSVEAVARDRRGSF